MPLWAHRYLKFSLSRFLLAGTTSLCVCLRTYQIVSFLQSGMQLASSSIGAYGWLVTSIETSFGGYIYVHSSLIRDVIFKIRRLALFLVGITASLHFSSMFDVAISCPRALPLILLLFLAGYIWQRWFNNTSLESVPGPARTSWWQGKWRLILCWLQSDKVFPGNLHQVYNRHGWGYNRYLADTFGGAVKINGLFGVRKSIRKCPLEINRCLSTTTE